MSLTKQVLQLGHNTQAYGIGLPNILGGMQACMDACGQNEPIRLHGTVYVAVNQINCSWNDKWVNEYSACHRYYIDSVDSIGGNAVLILMHAHMSQGDIVMMSWLHMQSQNLSMLNIMDMNFKCDIQQYVN